jgi:hypothetical protein
MAKARLSPARAILLGTAVVGTIDALDAIVFFGLRGSTPSRIFQSIASGLLGRVSYQRGLPAVALGVLIHYFVAFGIVATYVAASRVVPLLARRPVVCGMLYGIGVYFFMNLVIIPLSAVGPQRFTTGPFINGILIHAFGIGIPTALIAAHAASGRGGNSWPR